MESTGTCSLALDKVSISNGVGWSPDASTMCTYSSLILTLKRPNAGEATSVHYHLWPPASSKEMHKLTIDYVDSGVDEIRAFDYDVHTGFLTKGRVFASSPPPSCDKSPTGGVFDGLAMDGVGNIWVARWQESRVMGFSPEGQVIANIIVPGSLMTTIPCFGGE